MGSGNDLQIEDSRDRSQVWICLKSWNIISVSPEQVAVLHDHLAPFLSNLI